MGTPGIIFMHFFQVTAGALTGEAVLEALEPTAEEVDPGGVAVLAEVYARAAAGVDDNANAIANGGDVAGDVGGGRAEEEEGGLEGVVARLPAPSSAERSVLVDLGRTALKVGMFCLCSYFEVYVLYDCCPGCG